MQIYVVDLALTAIKRYEKENSVSVLTNTDK